MLKQHSYSLTRQQIWADNQFCTLPNKYRVLTLCSNGNMVSDADRQIARISYDRQNLPRRTDYLDGSHVDYTYDADGVKLRVDYYLSPYIMVPGDEFGIAVDST